MESIAPTFNNTHQFSIRYTMWWNYFSTCILVFFQGWFLCAFFQLQYWRGNVSKIICENTGPYKWKMRLFYRNYFIPLWRVMWDEYGFRNAQCTLGFQAKNVPTPLSFYPENVIGVQRSRKAQETIICWSGLLFFSQIEGTFKKPKITIQIH